MTLPLFGSGATNRRQYLEFNGQSSKDFLLYLSGPGIYNSPEPDVEATSIPGLNGDLIQNNAKSGYRRFNNVDIQYKAFFFNGLPAKTAAVKSWLLSPTGYCKLADTYDSDFFRMGMCTVALTFDVSNQKAAEMELTFNCKPQRWSVAGQEVIELTESGSPIYNPFEFYALPLIVVAGTVSGDAAATLTIGDCEVKLYDLADGAITLNCETQNAYLADGSFCNDQIYAEDFPALAPGENTIVWDGGITSVEITPRWWTL